MNSVEFYMKEALKEAEKSGGDIPIGAVIEYEGKIIARAHNLKEKRNDVTLHAEIIALKKANKKLLNWRLNGANIYVTLEPCPMCAWGILNSGIKNVYFGAYDMNYGAFGSKLNLINYSTRKPDVYGGILEEEARRILDKYFLKIRS